MSFKVDKYSVLLLYRETQTIGGSIVLDCDFRVYIMHSGMVIANELHIYMIFVYWHRWLYLV